MSLAVRQYIADVMDMLLTRTAGHAMTVVMGNLASALLRFTSSLLLAGVLSASEFGTLAVFIATMDVIAILSDLGLNVTMVRFIAADAEKSPMPIVRKTIAVKGALFGIIIVAAWMLAGRFLATQQIDATYTWLYATAVAAGLLLSIHGLMMAMAQAQSRYGRYAILSMLVNILRFSIIGVLVLSNATRPDTMYVAFFVAPALALPVAAMLTASCLKTRRDCPAPLVDYGGFLAFMLPLSLLQIVGIAMVRLNSFMLKGLTSAEEVGYYEIAFQIAFVLPLITRALFTVLLPKVTSMKSHVELRDYRARALRMYPVVLMMTGAVIVLGPILITLLFQDKYAPAINILRLITICFGLNVVTHALGLVFYNVGRPHCITVVQGLQLVALVPLNLVAIPKWGAMGAAASTLIVTIPAVLAIIVWTGRIIARLRDDAERAGPVSAQG